MPSFAQNSIGPQLAILVDLWLLHARRDAVTEKRMWRKRKRREMSTEQDWRRALPSRRPEFSRSVITWTNWMMLRQRCNRPLVAQQAKALIAEGNILLQLRQKSIGIAHRYWVCMGCGDRVCGWWISCWGRWEYSVLILGQIESLRLPRGLREKVPFKQKAQSVNESLRTLSSWPLEVAHWP